MCKMEQLAHFVTKSFEYNNNRVLEVINMSSKSLIYEKSSDSEVHSNGCDSDGGEDSMDIDITDLSSSDDVIRKMDTDDNANNMKNHHSPLSLIKKTGKDTKRYVTKNWLISDSPKRMDEIEGNRVLKCNLFRRVILLFLNNVKIKNKNCKNMQWEVVSHKCYFCSILVHLRV